MASISGMLAAISASKPKPTRLTKPAPSRWVGSGGCGGLVVECSSRPKKKATSHHMKTRPKKTQPWDVRRKGPTLYPPLPPLPSDWTLVSSSSSSSSSSELGDPQPTIQQAAELEPAT